MRRRRRSRRGIVLSWVLSELELNVMAIKFVCFCVLFLSSAGSELFSSSNLQQKTANRNSPFILIFFWTTTTVVAMMIECIRNEDICTAWHFVFHFPSNYIQLQWHWIGKKVQASELRTRKSLEIWIGYDEHMTHTMDEVRSSKKYVKKGPRTK